MNHAYVVIGLLSVAAVELVVIAWLLDQVRDLRNALDDMRRARTR
jgi:hypothetical protein